tara:strand:- start:42 stop:245 length:204 start_codon:yes stop_codon:yes gene_type:complete
MTQSRRTKIELYDRYIMQGGDMTLEEIESFVKLSLGVADSPLKPDAFDDFMVLIIEKLNDRNNTKDY